MEQLSLGISCHAFWTLIMVELDASLSLLETCGMGTFSCSASSILKFPMMRTWFNTAWP
jgi:hypothetical protein